MKTPIRNEKCTSLYVTPSMLQEYLEVTATGDHVLFDAK